MAENALAPDRDNALAQPSQWDGITNWLYRNAPEYLKESARSLYEGPRNRAQGLWDEFKDSRLSGQTAAGLGSTLDPVRMLPGANSGMLFDIPRTMYLSRFGTQELPAGTDVYKYSNAEDAAGQRFARENPETAQTIGASMEAQFSHPLGMGFVPHAVSRGVDRVGNALMEHTPGPDQVNMFAGPKAKTADLPKLEQAQSLESAGHSPDTIWKETGWFKGADDKWKFEIPDNEAMSGFGFTTRLGEALEHPGLYEAYPSLARITTRPAEIDGAGFHPGGRGIRSLFDKPYIEYQPFGVGRREEERSLLLHEAQHAIQEREGMNTGGNVGDLSDHALDQYRRLAGEVEARNVQARMNMTPEERMLTPPWKTQDVPNEQQIVRFGNEGVQESRSYTPPTPWVGYRPVHEAAANSLAEAQAARNAQKPFDYSPHFQQMEGANAAARADPASIAAETEARRAHMQRIRDWLNGPDTHTARVEAMDAARRAEIEKWLKDQGIK